MEGFIRMLSWYRSEFSILFKIIATLSLLLYGACLYLISQMNGSLSIFYLLTILLTIVALPTTPLGFTRVVNAWFEKHRGLALGISLTSTGLGAFFIPKYLTPYVANYGWEKGYILHLRSKLKSSY